jgi:hypothetical protein
MEIYSTYYISLLLIFSFVAYFIATDDSVAKYVILLAKIFKLNIERYVWMVKNHPRNPINKYFIWRRSLKLAEQLQKEFENK